MAKKYERIRLTKDIISLTNHETVFGKMGEIVKLQEPSARFTNGLFTFDLTNPDDGEVKTYWLNGGLKGAFKMGNVKPGMVIEITHTGLKALPGGEGGQEVNTYDVFELV